MTRGLIFDLDDTIYPERRFALSGYAAVAREVERACGMTAHRAFQVLLDALKRGGRPQAFQTLAGVAGLEDHWVVTFRDIYRDHHPRLRLPQASVAALAAARRSWRTAVLTNGLPAVQRNKVRALGLHTLVDQVVYAHEVGTGKPNRAVFLHTCQALGVSAGRSVMAGDDPWCDVDGARRAGLYAIRVRQGWHRDVDAGNTGPADVTVPRIADVPAAADALIQERARHAD